jgi:hypothetical protein
MKTVNSKNGIFNRIQNLNNLSNIFPLDVVKTKLNDEIKQDIFKEFRFKFIATSSSSCKIIKEIYNCYFQHFIITTEHDSNNNTKFLIPKKNVYDQFYSFGKSYWLDNPQIIEVVDDLSVIEM